MDLLSLKKIVTIGSVLASTVSTVIWNKEGTFGEGKQQLLMVGNNIEKL